MPRLMRCLYCGVLQDEPKGAKQCVRCGGELVYVEEPPPSERGSYIQVQMELDQVKAPAGRTVDRYLIVTIRTPAQIPPEEAAPTESGRLPLSFTAVLDVSGSMQGAKIIHAKEAVRQALRRLRDGDIFSLVTFSTRAKQVLKPTRLTPKSRAEAEAALHRVRAGGKTALCSGLEKGIKLAKQAAQETNLILLLSDGQANVGETDLEEIGYRAFQAREAGITTSTLGVGLDYNEALMVEIATQGGGRFYHVTDAQQIAAYMTGELGEIATLAAREAQLHLNLPDGAVIVPLSAAYPARQGDGQATITVGDIPGDLELEITLRLTVPPRPAGTKARVEGTLTYRSPAGNTLQTTVNPVTVRFVEQAAFSPYDGVVKPVVERVLTQMRAASVLNFARAKAKGSPAPAMEINLETVRAYATKLGEERATEELRDTEAMLRAVQMGAPMAAKQAIFRAHAAQRKTRSFDKT